MTSPRARCVTPRKILFSTWCCLSYLQMSLVDEHWRRARVRHVHVSRGRHVERPRGRAAWWPLVPGLAPGPGLPPGLVLVPRPQPRLQPQHRGRDPVPLLRGRDLGLAAGQPRGLGPVLPHVRLHPHSHRVLQVRSQAVTIWSRYKNLSLKRRAVGRESWERSLVQQGHGTSQLFACKERRSF